MAEGLGPEAGARRAAEVGAARRALLAGGGPRGLAAAQAAGVGPRTWREAFHRPLAALRAALAPGGGGGGQARRTMEALLEDAEVFYRGLLGDLQSRGGVAAGVPAPPPPGPARAREAARYQAAARTARECQRCLVCLGDLERYRQLHLTAPAEREFSRAEWFYLQAAYIFHPGGAPHNQLAVLAERQGQRVVALYRNVRSLCSAEPFPSARRHVSVTLRGGVAAANARGGNNRPPLTNQREFMRGFSDAFLLAVAWQAPGGLGPDDDATAAAAAGAANALRSHFLPGLARLPGPVLESYLRSVSACTVGGSATAAVLQLSTIALWAASEACVAGRESSHSAAGALLMPWTSWLLALTTSAAKGNWNGKRGPIRAKGYLLPGLSVLLEWLTVQKDFLWRWSGREPLESCRLLQQLGDLQAIAGRAQRGKCGVRAALLEDNELRGFTLNPGCSKGKLFRPWKCPPAAEPASDLCVRAARLQGSAEILRAWLVCRERRVVESLGRKRGNQGPSEEDPPRKVLRTGLLPGAAVTRVLLPARAAGEGPARWLSADFKLDLEKVWVAPTAEPDRGIPGNENSSQNDEAPPITMTLNPFVAGLCALK